MKSLACATLLLACGVVVFSAPTREGSIPEDDFASAMGQAQSAPEQLVQSTRRKGYEHFDPLRAHKSHLKKKAHSSGAAKGHSHTRAGDDDDANSKNGTPCDERWECNHIMKYNTLRKEKDDGPDGASLGHPLLGADGLRSSETDSKKQRDSQRLPAEEVELLQDPTSNEWIPTGNSELNAHIEQAKAVNPVDHVRSATLLGAAMMKHLPSTQAERRRAAHMDWEADQDLDGLGGSTLLSAASMAHHEDKHAIREMENGLFV